MDDHEIDALYAAAFESLENEIASHVDVDAGLRDLYARVAAEKTKEED